MLTERAKTEPNWHTLWTNWHKAKKHTSAPLKTGLKSLINWILNVILRWGKAHIQLCVKKTFSYATSPNATSAFFAPTPSTPVWKSATSYHRCRHPVTIGHCLMLRRLSDTWQPASPAPQVITCAICTRTSTPSGLRCPTKPMNP